MIKRLALMLAIGIMALGVLAACGGDDDNGNGSSNGSSSGGSNEFTIEALDTMRFESDSITVKAGEEVKIILDNTGSLPHDFTIDDINGTRVHILANGGEKAEGTFTAPSEPGTYEFYCEQPGHKQAGMVGTLTVE